MPKDYRDSNTHTYSTRCFVVVLKPTRSSSQVSSSPSSCMGSNPCGLDSIFDWFIM